MGTFSHSSPWNKLIHGLELFLFATVPPVWPMCANTLDRSRHFELGTFLNRHHYHDVWWSLSVQCGYCLIEVDSIELPMHSYSVCWNAEFCWRTHYECHMCVHACVVCVCVSMCEKNGSMHTCVWCTSFLIACFFRCSISVFNCLTSLPVSLYFNLSSSRESYSGNMETMCTLLLFVILTVHCHGNVAHVQVELHTLEIIIIPLLARKDNMNKTPNQNWINLVRKISTIIEEEYKGHNKSKPLQNSATLSCRVTWK